MTRFLLATDSVHTTAAACDYLAGRLEPGDAVTALSVREPGTAHRDTGDALNVATVRLGAEATVETETREGDPAEAILSAVEESRTAGGDRVDEVVMGARSGAPGAGEGLGDTALSVLSRASVPAVVVPLAGLE